MSFPDREKTPAEEVAQLRTAAVSIAAQLRVNSCGSRWQRMADRLEEALDITPEELNPVIKKLQPEIKLPQ